MRGGLTAVRTVGDWTRQTLAHEAFVFADDDAVRARCVPFVQDALKSDESLVVVVGDRVRRLLQDEFGEATQRFAVFAAAEDAWLGGAGTLDAYRASMQPLLASGRPWRLVGEPIWLAFPGGSQWSRYEAVANVAFAHYPYYSLCLHDRRRLSPELIEGQLRVHPMVWEGSEPVDNDAYVETDTFLRSVEPTWDPAPEATKGTRLTSARRALPELEALVGPANGRRDEVLLAVYELVSNALKAAGAAEVQHWLAGDTWVWEVSDDGPGLHAASAGYAPPAEDLDSGRGLWLARSLADDASVRADGPGTAIRLFFRLS